MLGGSANDIVIGDRSDETLFGGEGDDVLFGGRGRTFCSASPAPTSLGDNGNDILRGSAGADRLLGGSEDDWLAGGPDNDLLRGGEDVDAMKGKGGIDVIQAKDGFTDRKINCGPGPNGSRRRSGQAPRSPRQELLTPPPRLCGCRTHVSKPRRGRALRSGGPILFHCQQPPEDVVALGDARRQRRRYWRFCAHDR